MTGYHPGWRGWFTWGGRRGRLSYLGAGLLIALVIFLPMGIAGGIGAAAGAGGPGWLAVAGICLAVAAAVGAAVALLCTMAQRMRDIGMPVGLALAGYGLASAASLAAAAYYGWPEEGRLWNPDYPLWLNLLQLGTMLFACALYIFPGNAWLDEP